nr:beclin-1-like protein A [Dermatophagoides farinae]
MMMNFSKQIIVCLIFVFIQTISGCSDNNDEWCCHNNKCYKLIHNHQGAYSDSDRYCGQSRGRAVTIYSADEQKFIENYLRKIGYGKNVWIGGHRQNTKFAWRNDGTLIEGNVYANWASDHPTMNFAKACMQMNGMNASEPGKWIENFCFASNGILCERFVKDNDNDNNNDNDDDDDCDDCDNNDNNNHDNNNNNEWSCRNNKCYKLIRNQNGEFSDSDRYCGQARGRAVTIYSADEQKFLENYLRNIGYGKSVWVGGHRQNTKFSWRNDGILIEGDVYANWASNHPTMNFAKACMQMNGMDESEPGKWIENYCFASNGILCERFVKDHDNDNDNDDDDDDDDDDCDDCDNNDNNNNNNNNNNQCCQQIERNMERMRRDMEKRFDNMERKMDKMNNRIDKIDDRINQVRDDMKQFSDKIKQFEHSMKSLNVQEIERNFTGIASVLQYYSEQLHSIRHELDNHPSTDVDLNIVKRELIEYFQEKLEQKNLDEVVNDIKLSYVNFRRALMVKKWPMGNTWLCLKSLFVPLNDEEKSLKIWPK